MSLPPPEVRPAVRVADDAPMVDVVAAVVDGPVPPRRRARVGLLVCGAWLAVVVLGAATASLLPIKRPSQIDPVHRLQGLSAHHLLGTDQLGRDILSRVVYGSRVSIVVALASFAIGIVVGGALGLVAGYLRGRVETVVIWLTDVILSFPALVLLIALVAYVGPSLMHISLVLGLLAVPVYIRLTRAHTLSVAGEDFVLAARAAGAGRVRVLLREVAPNVAPSVIAYGFIAMSLTVVVEGTLSFLGLSVAAPTASWGGIIADGQHYLHEDPSMVIIPSVVLCVTVLALNISGEILRRRYELHAS